MDPRIGTKDSVNDTLVQVGNRDKRIAMYQHQKGGFSIYLYEQPDWEFDEEWLLKTYRNTKESADELFDKIESSLIGPR
jgi:hypothetical protein